MMGRQTGDQSQLFYLFKPLRKVRFSEGLPCPATSLAVRPNFPTQNRITTMTRACSAPGGSGQGGVRAPHWRPRGSLDSPL
jgi:hypothetical protein